MASAFQERHFVIMADAILEARRRIVNIEKPIGGLTRDISPSMVATVYESIIIDALNSHGARFDPYKFESYLAKHGYLESVSAMERTES